MSAKIKTSQIDPNRKAKNPTRDFLPKPPKPKVAQVSDWVRKPEPEPRPTPGAKKTSAPKLKIWDIEVEKTPEPAPDIPQAIFADNSSENAPLDPMPGTTAAPKPTSNQAKTRLLGFNTEGTPDSIFDGKPADTSAESKLFPIGWLVVVAGPGRGACFTLTAGLSTIGRDADQTVSLDFGDAAISRQNHISIAYDAEENRTFVGHGGKTNIVRLNEAPLLTTEELNNADRIKIGKTELQFVAFCSADFSWGSCDIAREAHE
ncbi:MAG: FHA domain-containing protein [Pseudomonadota bacterium]